MTTPVTFAICGCGSRGLEAYAPFQELHPERMRIAAGADSRPERLAMLRERYGLAEDRCFASDEELLAQPRLADAMIIATQDRQHVPAALAALDKGYHLLLEKPISPEDLVPPAGGEGQRNRTDGGGVPCAAVYEVLRDPGGDAAPGGDR